MLGLGFPHSLQVPSDPPFAEPAITRLVQVGAHDDAQTSRRAGLHHAQPVPKEPLLLAQSGLLLLTKK